MNRERADRLVSLRAAHEDVLRREVAAAQQRVSATRARLDELGAELERRRVTRSARSVAAHELARTEAYIERLRAEMQVQRRALALVEQELAEVRDALTGAARARAMAETLLEREEETLAAREAADEQNELDDTTTRARLGEER